ncbi:hypothetical protein EIN_314720 [Entamoeba invadens IP1]|uniref:HMG box domain-containing protein n=1 Tax=Entamoeba invadens IP1 TaxID=370355 RepID=A0A0A1U2N1_ENTIV|nr:hypothetical protein EIN_314720 [Entamoeba invadens IP1]ELP86913.1 hypothetical protein EIN_314720 [Entamoeba invadens IP1]|eukprot:XP_004253684.1 hypothetical protein EIN_314720 [Entamoeba invadens IP1]
MSNPLSLPNEIEPVTVNVPVTPVAPIVPIPPVANNSTDPAEVAALASKEEKKPRKKKEVNEDVEEMAQALFIYWKSKELLRTNEYQYDDANEKAEELWHEEADEQTLDLFRKAAAVQIVMLGGEFVAQKKRRQAKSEMDRNRAECNPFLLFCKDHRDNVREKGSRGKGMTTLSGMWKLLPDEEKEKYVTAAKQNKCKEKQIKTEFEGQNDFSGVSPAGTNPVGNPQGTHSPINISQIETIHHDSA